MRKGVVYDTAHAVSSTLFNKCVEKVRDVFAFVGVEVRATRIQIAGK